MLLHCTALHCSVSQCKWISIPESLCIRRKKQTLQLYFLLNGMALTLTKYTKHIWKVINSVSYRILLITSHTFVLYSKAHTLDTNCSSYGTKKRLQEINGSKLRMNETNKPLNTSSAARKSRKLLNGVSCMCVRVVFSISFVDLHLNASHILPSSVYANRYLHNVAPALANAMQCIRIECEYVCDSQFPFKSSANMNTSPQISRYRCPHTI